MPSRFEYSMVDRTFETNPYEQSHIFASELRGRSIKYSSKPGLNRWNHITPSTSLIAEYVDVLPDDRIFIFGCGHGASAVSLARLAYKGEILLTDINLIAFEMSRRTLEMNSIRNATLIENITIPLTEPGKFDRVIIDLPKGRHLAQRWLIQAWDILRLGGYLYISGSNEEGIQSVLKDGEAMWGPYSILGYHKGNRIARFKKNELPVTLPSWITQPGIQPGSWHGIDISVEGFQLHLCTLPGIFSFDRLDKGTRILLETIRIPDGSILLDLGCGYGVIGVVAALTGAKRVDMVDTNLLAISASQENVKWLDLYNANVIPSDALLSVKDRRYSLILTNPPFHSGKKVDFQMAQAFIKQSWQQLEPAGQFALVANQFIRYDDVMRPLFRQVTQAAHTEGFQVWVGTK